MDKVSPKTSKNLASCIFNKIDILNNLIKGKSSYELVSKSLIEYFAEQYGSAFVVVSDRKQCENYDVIKCLASECGFCEDCIFDLVSSDDKLFKKGEVRELFLNYSNYARYNYENVFCDLDIINFDEIIEKEQISTARNLMEKGIKTLVFLTTRKDRKLETLIVLGFEEKLDPAVINSLKFVIPYVFLCIYHLKAQDNNILIDIYDKPFKNVNESQKMGFAFLNSHFDILRSNYNFRKMNQLNEPVITTHKNIREIFSSSEQQTMIKSIEKNGNYIKFIHFKDVLENYNYLKLEIEKAVSENVDYYFVYLIEVTEKNYLENQLKKNLRELKIKNQEIEIQKNKVIEASKIKNQFLANISHELRTPLNAIIGFSEVLLSGIYGKLSDKQGEYSSYINDSGYHLLNLINDILDLSKIEAGKIGLKKENINVRDEVASILRLLDNPIKDKNIEVVVNVPEDHSLKVDKKRFRQILLNLIENAKKFTNNGGIIKIDSVLNKETNNVEISIQDNGIGIDEKNIESVFEPFKQIDAEYTRRTEGVGLGLALVKSFVEQHKGKIWCESRLGEGAKFTFSMPACTETERLVVLYISNDEVPKKFNNLVHSLGASLDYYKLSNDFSLQEKIDNVDIILANSDLSGNQVNEVIQRYSLCDNPDKVPLYVSSISNEDGVVLNNIQLTNTDIGIKEFLNTNYPLLNCFDKNYKSFSIIYTQDDFVFGELEKQFDKEVFEVIQVKTVDELVEITSDFSISSILLDFSSSIVEKEKVLQLIRSNTFTKTLKAIVIPFSDDALSINIKPIMGDEYSLKKVINNIKVKNKWRI